MLKTYSKQDNIAPRSPPPPPHTTLSCFNYELDPNVKVPLLRLLQFLSDLKSTNPCQTEYRLRMILINFIRINWHSKYS